MKSDTITFTSTFSSGLMEWVEERAKKEKKTKRSVLEEAVDYYKHTVKKKEIEKGYERMAKDKEYMKEMVEMAEEDMTSYSQQLNKYL